MDDELQNPDIGTLREDLFSGFIPFNDFAAAIDRHPKTLKRMNPPIVYVGRTPFIPKEKGKAWLLNGCRPVEPERRRRGRGRAA